MLAVPRQLLVLAGDLDKYSRLREELLAFIGAALKLHPILASEEALTGQSPVDAAQPSQALATIARLDFTAIRQLVQAHLEKRPQRAELRRNTLYALAAWFYLRREITAEQLFADLFRHLWSREAEGVKNAARRFARVLDVRDSAAVGVACEQFAEQAREQARLAAGATKAASEHLEKLQAQIKRADDLGSRLEDAQHEITALRETVDRQRQQHSDELVHLRDDLERLRTRALRRLREEISLLEAGLHAARLNPPKLHVLLDHADRAIDGLRQEAKHLEVES
jgi:hypothetical protein